MNILDFIIKEALIMIPVLWILVEIVKGLEKLDNKYLPLFALGFSLILTPLLLQGYNIDNIIQAILIAGTTVFADQIKKQFRKEDEPIG